MVKNMYPEQQPDSSKIISPFANTEAAVAQVSRKKSSPTIWIILGIVLVAVGGTVGIFVNNYLNDTYRTLEPFPISRYLEGPTTLLGSRFKGDLRVEANLGWRENVGNLMLFSMSDDPHPIVVMVPATVAKNVNFTKGQTYLAELEVKEGGLIYANSVKKN